MKNPIVPMTHELAAQVAAWRYPAEYAVYNWQEDEPLDELLDGSSYGLLNRKGELVGFYQFGEHARIPTREPEPYGQGPLDVGLGLRPDLCGLGFGPSLLLAGLDFARNELGAGGFRLTVAGFNQRAWRAYVCCGFRAQRQVTHKATGEAFVILAGPDPAGRLEYRGAIEPEEYCRLRKAVGWSAIRLEQAAQGLAGSAYVAGCYEGEVAVGSARLLWDGGYTAYLTDVMVLPAYQSQGAGTRMVEDCLAFLRAQMRPGWRFKVHLLAGRDKEGFYQRFGFCQRPNENAGPAMDMWLQ